MGKLHPRIRAMRIALKRPINVPDKEEYKRNKLPKHFVYITRLSRSEHLYFIHPDKLAIAIHYADMMSISHKKNVGTFLDKADIAF